MKNFFLAITLLGLLVLGSRDVQAQAYGPYYYDPYWDAQYQQYQQYLQWQQYLAYLQQYDPYYDLHVTHYQLYPQPYQRIKYTNLLLAGVVTVPTIAPRPRPVEVRGDEGLSLRYRGRPLNCRQRSEEGKGPGQGC
jgi:hypothetical protein